MTAPRGAELVALLEAHRTLANGPGDYVCACNRTWTPSSERSTHLADVLIAAGWTKGQP